MEVNRITGSIGGSSGPAPCAGAVNFTGKVPEIKDLLPKGGKVLNFMDKFKFLKGELGGILITALGTGLVAPIFIAHNPFAKPKPNATEEEKEDFKNTKKYTAMRQPISAVLAIVFQALALKPIDVFLEKIYNDPNYAKNLHTDVDQSVLNKSSYIERQVKKQMKAEGKSFKTKAGKEELAQRVKDIEAQQLSDVAQRLRNTGRIEVSGGRFIDDKTVAELVNGTINSYIEDAKSLKIDDKGLSFYSKRAEDLINNETALKDILSRMPETGNEAFLKTEIQNASNSELKTLLQEILDRPENIRIDRLKNSITRIDNIKEICGGTYDADKYLSHLIERNGELDKIITRLRASKIADVVNADPNTIRKAMNEAQTHCSFDGNNKFLKSFLDGTGTFKVKGSNILEKISADVSKAYKNLIDNKYRSNNQITKILIGILITLPITCNALNWVYPRFMKIFFPNLAGESKPEDKVEIGGGK